MAAKTLLSLLLMAPFPTATPILLGGQLIFVFAVAVVNSSVAELAVVRSSVAELAVVRLSVAELKHSPST